jgi:Putative metallopeptidase
MALCLGAMQPAFAAPGVSPNPQIKFYYLRPKSADFTAISQRLQKRRVLEEFTEFLAPLRLPKKLTLQFDECGAPTRPYDPRGTVATICYELIDRIEHIAAEVPANARELVLTGTVIQVIFHEAAKAVFDILQVPIWGREEDAADRLAGLLMTGFSTDVTRKTIFGTALFFAKSGRAWNGSQFADRNSPEAQRYYNYLCMAYGSDPKTFDDLTKAQNGEEAALPDDRAARCTGEYLQVLKAFNLRIMPHVDPDLLVQVRAIPWSLASSGKM